MTYLPDKANLQDIREVNTQSPAHEHAKYYYNEHIVVLPGKRFMSNYGYNSNLLAGFLYSSCNFQLFWKGLPGPQNRISLRLYFIPSVKNALCTKYLWLDIVPFFINWFYLRSPIEVVAHSRALVSRTEKQKRKNKGKALPGNKQNLAGKF